MIVWLFFYVGSLCWKKQSNVVFTFNATIFMTTKKIKQIHQAIVVSGGFYVGGCFFALGVVWIKSKVHVFKSRTVRKKILFRGKIPKTTNTIITWSPNFILPLFSHASLPKLVNSSQNIVHQSTRQWHGSQSPPIITCYSPKNVTN